MKAEELNKLMEAYNSMYAPKEEVVESEQLDEFLGPEAQDTVDRVTKKIQGGLEKMGVPINRTKRPTATSVKGADYMRKGGVGQSEKPTGLHNSADLFDIVKGYLMSEGLTEEEALQKMITMTEEERTEIIEGSCMGGDKKKKKK